MQKPRVARHGVFFILVAGEGFEPSKAEPSDLQSDPFDRSGIPPEEEANNSYRPPARQPFIAIFLQFFF